LRRRVVTVSITGIASFSADAYHTKMTTHTTHPDIIKRLKRADGHLKSIIAMLEEDRDCLEIVQQLHAVEKAISNAKKVFVHDHIDHCLETATGKNARNARATIDEFKEITKYL
jgi:DNA-binding FrmR family transcriptional regulator